MRRIGWTAVAVATVAVLASGTRIFAAGDQENEGGRWQRECSLETLRGRYVFTARGFNIVAGVAQPKAILEIVDFNGDGTLTVPAATVSINGNIVRALPSVGTYTLDESCSGTIAFGGPSYDTFVEQTGKEFWLIQTNPNTVFQGTATRLSR